ncbi:hydrolase [Salinisphaera orenii]|uniref:hydrolase n=1 Tax=Salinisphaera orenii TaxID=856731 RepID=UPI000DBE4D59
MMETGFRPAPWCRNPHLQTVVAGLLRRPPAVTLTVDTIELADGDFLDVSISTWPAGPGAPVALILAGINGGPESPYVRGIVAAFAACGIRSAVMHYRGLARPNRLPETFHSGRTEDIAAIVAYLAERFPDAPRVAVGYSLGGNMLLKYLGERGDNSALAAAAAVSVPFDLAACAEALRYGLRRGYQRYLLSGLKAMAHAKQANATLPLADIDWSRLTTFASFDDYVTAPLNGFDGAADYYARVSCAPFLSAIQTPTLIAHARDDPFMVPAVIPGQHALSSAIRLELTDHGGHVGFVGGRSPWRPCYWLEQRIPKFMAERLSCPSGR